jgi:hypothetical protein
MRLIYEDVLTAVAYVSGGREQLAAKAEGAAQEGYGTFEEWTLRNMPTAYTARDPNSPSGRPYQATARGPV